MEFPRTEVEEVIVNGTGIVGLMYWGGYSEMDAVRWM